MLDVKRHRGVFDPDSFSYPVHIVGCGGMGSRVAEGLVRMGVGIKGKSPIILHDYDCFEEHNLTNQWVSDRYVGMYKVHAVKAQMQRINKSASIRTRVGKVNGHTVDLAGVVFLCLDDMDTRREIVDGVLAANKKVWCVIETRMDAGVGISHCFSPNNEIQLECWRLYWFSNEEVDNIRGCGDLQSIISAIYGTTALALKQFEQFARTNSTEGMSNRVYVDFESFVLKAESWPLA